MCYTLCVAAVAVTTKECIIIVFCFIYLLLNFIPAEVVSCVACYLGCVHADWILGIFLTYILTENYTDSWPKLNVNCYINNSIIYFV